MINTSAIPSEHIVIKDVSTYDGKDFRGFPEFHIDDDFFLNKLGTQLESQVINEQQSMEVQQSIEPLQFENKDEPIVDERGDGKGLNNPEHNTLGDEDHNDENAGGNKRRDSYQKRKKETKSSK